MRKVIPTQDGTTWLVIEQFGALIAIEDCDGEFVFVGREQAAQLAEVLKRYSETGRIDE
nr:MAG TPA: putative lipoprotein [Caudoviricetes sp.]